MIKNKIDRREMLRYIVIIFAGFFLSRVIFPGGVIPLGYGFFAASLEHNINSVLAGIVVCVGALSTGFNARSIIVVISVLVMSSFKILVGNTGNNKKAVGRIMPFLFSGIIASSAVIIVNGFIWRDMLISIIQNMISLIAYYIFQGAVRAFSSKNGRYILSEDISSLAITLILCVFGFPQISLFGLNLRNVIGIFLIIALSYKGSYGLLARLGKAGTSISIAVLSVSLSIMLGSPDNIINLLKDVIAADLIFFVLPDKILNRFKLPGASNINRVVEKANYADDMSTMVIGRLEGFSQGYSVLARSFAKFAKGEEPERKDGMLLAERIYTKVCDSCDMTEFCWKRLRMETARAFTDMSDSLERNGKIIWENVPVFFQDKCEKTEAVLTEMRLGYEINRVEKIWKQRLAESKGVYAMQLGSLASAAHNLALEMKSDIKLMVKVSETLETELKKSGYKDIKATVIQNRFGKYEVSVDYKGDADNGILRIISGVLNKKMVSIGDYNYIEANRLKVLTGAAAIAKKPGDISGDSYTFINGKNGCFSAVLCDGMGTGKKARDESGMAIRMIENFSYNGFDNETAVEMINSALVMKTEEDSYSTLDLVSINLQNGNVDILKYGGMPTVIKYKLKEEEYSARREFLPSIESISSTTLPVGIMNDVTSRSIRKKVCDGDCIVMMTDGVFDAFRQGGKSGGDLIRYIEMAEFKKPQELADNILKEALNMGAVTYKMAAGEASSGTGDESAPPDDMTVLVLEVCNETK